MLHIKLLGNLGLDYGDNAVTGVDTPRLQSLLAYLLLHTDAPQPRRHLAFLFWPDSTEKQARTNLRQLLHHLRDALPDADRFIDAGTHTLHWRPDAPITVDVESFRQTLARARQADENGHPDATQEALEEAIDLYRDDLLLGCYDEWIEPERERLRQEYLGALDRLVRLLEKQRAYSAAIRYAGRLLQKDPLRETSYRTVMRLHALRNDRASALRVYHECASVLERELAVEPGMATRELYERLLNMQVSEDGRQGAQTPAADSKPAERPPGSAAELPLVGRQRDWDQLREAWRIATREHAHFALIAGEAGIGKSRLAEELLTWAGRQGVTTARTRCYAAEGRLAFAPVADWLRTDTFRGVVQKQDAVWSTEIARILPELLTERPDLHPPEPLTESWQRRRFFEALARALLAASRPILLLIDDLQWCDKDTLEWLHYLLRFDRSADLLVVGTVRIEEADSEHPLETLLVDLGRTALLTEIVLGPLNSDETTELAEHVASTSLGADQAAYLYRETEGNPLFVVETMRAGGGSLDRAEPSAAPSPLPGSPDELPPRVYAILKARLAQCSQPARALASLAAVIGRAFTYDALAEASGHDEDTLIRGLDELWHRRIVREYRHDTYDFSHDKLREVAYAELSPARRRRLHRRVAEALEHLHEGALEGISGRLAAHYERAGRPDRALSYYQRAAEGAQGVYANEEAIRHLKRGLVLLDERPASPQRDATELGMLVLLGSSVASTRGYAAPETGHVYTRALDLCHADADPRLRFSVYWGSYGFNLVRAELGRAHEFAEQCRVLAEAEDNPTLLVAAHCAVGISLAHLGELKRARVHLERARAQHNPAQRHFQMGADPGVFSLAYLSHVLWLLGYPDQALRQGRVALALAENAAHPFSRVIALSYLAMLHQFRSETAEVLECAESALALTSEYGFPYYDAWGMIMKGWALHRQGQRADGTSHMQTGLSALRNIGTGLRGPYYLSLLAESRKREGRFEEGLGLLNEALSGAARTEERWQEAELHRLNGDLLLGQNTETAEACFHKAIEVARNHNSRSLELRAAISLSRLWQGRRRKAGRQLLESVCDAFTEGYATPDLQEAQALLHGLS